VRFGDWKAVRSQPGASLELYDLRTDPGERQDLAGANPEMVARAEASLNRRSTCLGGPAGHEPATVGIHARQRRVGEWGEQFVVRRCRGWTQVPVSTIRFGGR
jgi:hypothetical protein